MHKYIYSLHKFDKFHLDTVKNDMLKIGSPKITVVDCGDHYQALDGTHRLEAAAQLNFIPELIIKNQDDLVDQDFFENWDNQDKNEFIDLKNPITYGELVFNLKIRDVNFYEIN
jgi:hypothetical protein